MCVNGVKRIGPCAVGNTGVTSDPAGRSVCVVGVVCVWLWVDGVVCVCAETATPERCTAITTTRTTQAPMVAFMREDVSRQCASHNDVSGGGTLVTADAGRRKMPPGR